MTSPSAITDKATRGDTKVPPGPKGRLFTGHLHALRGDRLAFYTRCVREYGDVVALRFFTRPILLLSHPDLVESVLVTQARHFTKHFALRFNPEVFGQGLLTSEGDFWLRQRRLIQPAFDRQHLVSFAVDMVAATQRLLGRWSPGQTVDVQTEMMRLTLDIAAQTLFGIDATADAGAVSSAMAVLQESFLAQFLRSVPLPMWVPTPLNFRRRRAVRRLDDVIYRFIARCRAGGEQRGDLLSLLLAARDEGDGRGMTDKQVRDEALTLFLAGHETTALALSWTWYLLATNPEAQARVVQEWQEILHGRNPTADDVPRLRNTRAVVQEALRLYPPAFAFGREARQECRLGDYRVPRGMTVLMSPWVLHRDSRWWDQPEVFRPERWLEGHPAKTPKYAYVPFGGGPRLCIGNQFALLEAVLVLATLGQRYRFTMVPGHPVVPSPIFTLRLAHGLLAKLENR
jgi:cytochrome P450